MNTTTLDEMLDEKEGECLIQRRVSKTMLQSQPYLVWNAFINLLAMESYDDLTEIQRIAHLCFWYDSEVQNGGHLQYFENQGTKYFEETLKALVILGGHKQSKILESAFLVYTSKVRKKIKTVFEFVGLARAGEYQEFDNKYYAINPRVTELLEIFLNSNQDHFVLID